MAEEAAVRSFSKAGNLTLGGNFTVAMGPRGRCLEGNLVGPADIYTYSKTKGLFVGASMEGSAIIEKKGSNDRFYGTDIRAVDILSGKVAPPANCEELYNVLDEMRQEESTRMARMKDPRHPEMRYVSGEEAKAVAGVHGKKLPSGDKYLVEADSDKAPPHNSRVPNPEKHEWQNLNVNT